MRNSEGKLWEVPSIKSLGEVSRTWPCDILLSLLLLFSQRKLNPGKSRYCLLIFYDLTSRKNYRRILFIFLAPRHIRSERPHGDMTHRYSLVLVLPSSCLRNMTRTSAPRVPSCLAVRSSASPSPGRSYVTRRSCSWMRPPLPWTPRARRYASLNAEQQRHRLLNPQTSHDSTVQLLDILRARRARRAGS